MANSLILINPEPVFAKFCQKEVLGLRHLQRATGLTKCNWSNWLTDDAADTNITFLYVECLNCGSLVYSQSLLASLLRWTLMSMAAHVVFWFSQGPVRRVGSFWYIFDVGMLVVVVSCIVAQTQQQQHRQHLLQFDCTERTHNVFQVIEKKIVFREKSATLFCSLGNSLWRGKKHFQKTHFTSAKFILAFSRGSMFFLLWLSQRCFCSSCFRSLHGPGSLELNCRDKKNSSELSDKIFCINTSTKTKMSG